MLSEYVQSLENRMIFMDFGHIIIRLWGIMDDFNFVKTGMTARSYTLKKGMREGAYIPHVYGY